MDAANDSSPVEVPAKHPRALLSKRLHVSVLLAVCLCLFLLTSARAMSRAQTMAGMVHTSWGPREGLDGTVRALAQTQDGYLWLGGTGGLYRFDGLKFQSQLENQLPSRSVVALTADTHGGLWIGFEQGGAAYRAANGSVTVYPAPDKFPVGHARRFVITPDGRVWATATGNVVCLEGGKWRRIGKAESYTGNSADTLFVDSAGTLWAATGGTIQKLPLGATRFQTIGPPLHFVPTIYEDLQGAIWALDGDGDLLVPLQKPTGTPARKALPHNRSSELMISDSDGTLWISRMPGGIRRVSQPEALRPNTVMSGSDNRIEVFTHAQGLSSALPNVVLEDREGNIWIGSDEGLDRFRYRNATSVEMPPYTYNYLLFRGDAGHIYSAMRSGSAVDPAPVIDLFDGRVLTHTPTAAFSTYRAPDGDVWISESHRLDRLSGNVLHQESPPPHPIGKFVQSMTFDHEKHRWVALNGAGLFREDTDGWTFLKPVPEIPDLTPTHLETDSDGRIWIMYPNALAVFSGGQLHRFTSPSDFTLTPFNTLVAASGAVWIAGERGLGLLRGNSIQHITGPDGESLRNVNCVIPSAQSGLWLCSDGRVLHVTPEHLQPVLNGTSSHVSYETYDLNSDLPEQVKRGVEAADGTLWFVANTQVVKMSPDAIRHNQVPPSIVIDSISADGHDYLHSSRLAIPALTRNLSISFGALSLTVPERVRAKYRLEKWDKDWQDAGLRRTAYYTNLPPGHYTFRVIACNNDGLWNEEGTSVSFDILPAFYQTLWFRILCAAFGLLLIWCGYLFRLHRVTTELKGRMIARTDERERITHRPRTARLPLAERSGAHSSRPGGH